MNERTIDRWKRLRGNHEGDSALEVPSVDAGVDTGYGNVRFALGPAGQPRLLMPIPASGAGLVANQPAPQLHLTTCKLSLRGKATHYLDLMCVDRGLDPVFAELADDILRRLTDGCAPATAVDHAIADFRRLLRRSAGADVADQELVGLIGEMIALDCLGSRSIAAASSWTGPFGQRHDFRSGHSALEVKTSSSAGGTRVRINGIDQLSAPDGGELALAHVRLERAAGGAFGIGVLFDSLVQRGLDEPLIRRALGHCGCADPHDPGWNRLRFELVDLRMFRVSGDFPRLCAEHLKDNRLPHGVGGVQYELDLDAASHMLMDEHEQETFLQRIAG